MHCHKTISMKKSKASHMISNDFYQSGTEMISAEMSSFLSFSQALRYLLLKVKGTCLAKRLVKRLAILLKSLINLLENPTCPKKDQILFTHLGIESLAMIFTSIPFLKIVCPKIISYFTMKWNFSQFSVKLFSSHCWRISSRW